MNGRMEPGPSGPPHVSALPLRDRCRCGALVVICPV